MLPLKVYGVNITLTLVLAIQITNIARAVLVLNLFPQGRHFANSSALQFSVLPLSPWAFYLDFPKCTRRAHSITLGGTMASSKTQTYAAFLYLKFSLEESGAPLLKVFCLWKHCWHERWRKMAYVTMGLRSNAGEHCLGKFLILKSSGFPKYFRVAIRNHQSGLPLAISYSNSSTEHA